jgi:hypothetical protein
MRAENPIAGQELADAEVLAAGATSLLKVGILAGRFRRVICGLLFLGVIKNYMDRQILGVFEGPLQHEFSLGVPCSVAFDPYAEPEA